MKTAVTVILLFFVAASVVFLVVGGPRFEPGQHDGDKTASAPTATPVVASTESATITQQTDKPAPKLVVYYFHRTQRCHTCQTMEAYAKDVLTSSFPEQFESGKLEWRLVDIETPANEHFVQDFELTSNALVMVKHDGDKQTEWKSLERIWELVGNEEDFKAYVRDQAQAYLKDGA